MGGLHLAGHLLPPRRPVRPDHFDEDTDLTLRPLCSRPRLLATSSLLLGGILLNLTKMTGIQHGVDKSDDDMDVIIAAAASFVLTTVAAQTSILAVLKRRVRKRRVGPYRRRTDHTITPLIDDDTECRKLLGVPRAVVGLVETTLLPQIQPWAGQSVLDKVVTHIHTKQSAPALLLYEMFWRKNTSNPAANQT